VVQPEFAPLNKVRFAAPPGKLKHSFIWESGRVTMLTSRVSANGSTSVVSQHVFTSEIRHRALNLSAWLFMFTRIQIAN
jgi:hypothetical protein